MEITDVRIRRLRVIEDVGMLDLAWSPGDQLLVQKGGGSYVEVITDEGLVGIGPEIECVSHHQRCCTDLAKGLFMCFMLF